MSWKELLGREIESTYSVTEKLMDLVDESKLDWKPASGANWMTTGQLVQHLTHACGQPFRGFATGDWGMPEGASFEDISPEEMLPPAEKMPHAESIAKAKALLAADKKLAVDTLAALSEEELATRPTPAPWDPRNMILGHRLLSMIEHLKQHKGQLFYYLKLQGLPVNTQHLWGL